MTVIELAAEIHNKYLKVFSKIKEYLENNSFGEFYFDVCYDQIYLQTDFSKYYNYNDDSHYEILPFSMLYGLLVDFFEENGIIIDVESEYIPEWNSFGYKYVIKHIKNRVVKRKYSGYSEKLLTKQKAILSACEILEGRL